ncbi:hypothetical protein [Shimia sp.]|uniref:hypothetical protein n=1 Tax=Shimia sp. TaxID=1954381 RepID=UPI00329A752D
MKKLTKFLCAGVAALGLSGGVASSLLADTPVTYNDGSNSVFRINVPDFWSARVGGHRELTAPGDEGSRVVDRVIGLQPERDSGVWVGFVSPNGLSTLDEAAEYARSLAPQIAKDTEITDFENRNIAGYPSRVYRGHGRRDGNTVYFTVSLIDLPNGRVIFSMTALQPGYEPTVLDDVNAIYNSIRSQ